MGIKGHLSHIFKFKVPESLLKSKLEEGVVHVRKLLLLKTIWSIDFRSRWMNPILLKKNNSSTIAKRKENSVFVLETKSNK